MPRATAAALASVSLFAAYAKYYQSFQNGFIDLLSSMADRKSLSGLPGGLQEDYTGIRPLDQFMTACNVFFWPVFQGGSPTLSLYGVAFASAMVPMWLLIVVETHQRRHPLAALVVVAFVAGPLIQGLGPGLVMPAILAFMSVSTHAQRLPFRSDLGSFPLSIILGYILPLSLAALAAPTVIAYDTKQQIIALWQGWPLYTSLLMGISRWLTHAQLPQPPQLKVACVFALACSTAGHLAFLCVTALGGYPKDPIHLTGIYSRRVYLPPAPWGETQVTSLETGVLRFLQWDYTLSALAMLFWTVAVYYRATRRRNRRSPWVLLMGRVVVGTIFLGPCSVAIVLYWETIALVADKGRNEL
ncbi:uncharacterized protein BDW43DRAFT_316918 [Aspergillus alliaceus]|uniref:uncharacterized protein n=1 Tax=Petromyces alliaceus TaxID=209559 RepID=UPI0012A776ED|nr:uncharacterized protein BDW43DRAFT_316918 [Aspergillus alliaceus]KAB8227331.1 hypothetical protein BDW43DRAFT_316918 [Aspergillus alliaceus]